ncbi:MAG: IS66 family transposase, partial [Clostridia bacterium]
LFDSSKTDEAQPVLPVEPVLSKIPVAQHSRKKKRTLEEMCESLPVEELTQDLSDDEKMNADGTPLCYIGVEYVRSELVMERAKAKVVKHFRKVYADRTLEAETGDTEIRKPEMPPPLLRHSYASASVVTDVLIKKYVDAMPLYRQEQMWSRMGIHLQRGTMANWVMLISDTYLNCFWQRLKQELLSQAVIHADETVLQVLKEDNRPATSDSRMWVYASSKRAEKQIRCFEYRDSRKGECARDFLTGFQGALVSDGYSGYGKVSCSVHGGCWAHMRRKWVEAMPKGVASKVSTAAQGYDLCNRLFAAEQTLEALSDNERTKQRQIVCAPILAEYWSWLDTIQSPSGKLKDAVVYAHNQKEVLCAFLSHGEMEISNNQVENAIRPFVVGRKGWLFSDTPRGAKASAIVYSLMETAKANGLNLEKYLYHLLTVLPERLGKSETLWIEDLLPWTQEMQGFAL